MKKLSLLLTCVIYFNQLFSQQTIEKKPGYTLTTITKTGLGKITVYLPDDIRPGESISGTVQVFPEGKKEKDIEKNREILNKSTINIGGKGFPVNVFSIGNIVLSNQEIMNLPVKITGADGIVLYQTVLPGLFTNTVQPSALFKIPSHALTGSPFKINGPFDGNSSNTSCSIGDKPAEILAESPRQCVVNFPADVKNPASITLVENGKTLTQNISAVDLNVNAGKLNLKKGENTFIDVAVTGLQNLPGNALLTITNITPATVNMTGGNVQAITILSATTLNTGAFNQRFNVQSVQTGNFNLNIDLDLPQPSNNDPATDLTWCSCNVGTTTMITRRKYCDALQKSIDQHLNNNVDNTRQDITPFSIRLNTSNVNDELQIRLDNNGSHTFDQVIFTYQKITPGNNADESLSFDLDSISQDGFQTFRPTPQLDQGVYNIGAIGFYGNNQQVNYSSFIVIPGKSQTPTVTNSEIDSLKREEKRYRDSINNINKRIEDAEKKIEKNNDRLHYLDSILQHEYDYVNELTQIDATIESIPGTYSEDLQILIDSLKNFKAKVGNLSPAQLQKALDDLDDKIKDLEDALKACQDHLAALDQEEKDLAAEKAQIEADQKQAYNDIIQELRNAGYEYAGFSGRDASTGQFNYGYGVVLRGPGGSASYYKGAVPAQSLSKIGALNKKIDAMNQRHKEIGDRQKQIPKEREDTKKECDRLADELNKAKEARKKAADNLAENNAITAELQNIYNQIAELLGPLADWCTENPGNTSLEQKVKALLAALANNPEDYENILKQLEDLIGEKKKVENEHRSKIERIQIEVNGLNDENQKLEDGIENDKKKGEGMGGGLGNTLDALGQAVENALAAAAAAEAAQAAERKRVCIEWLTVVAGGGADGDGGVAGMMAILGAIKDNMMSMGGILSDGLGAASALTEEKTKEKIDKIKGLLDQIIGPLQDMQDMIDEINEIKDIIQKLETLLSSDDTPEARAKKFGALMGLVTKVLNEVAEKFPLLQFFTSYFTYLVDGYNAAVDGVYNAFSSRYKEIIVSVMGKISCEKLMDEYMKNKSMEDVNRLAYKLCNGDSYVGFRSGENKRVFQEEVNKAVLKKMIDCCLKWSS